MVGSVAQESKSSELLERGKFSSERSMLEYHSVLGKFIFVLSCLTADAAEHKKWNIGRIHTNNNNREYILAGSLEPEL